MKDCFVICPLDHSDSAIRKRSDTILKYVLAPVLENLDYRPIRADNIPKAGLITTQVINMIIESPLVIADLTGGNPNVFYELAIRHAIKKPYIQIIEKGEKIPFDIGAVRTIPIDHTNLDSVEEAKKEIYNQINEFQRGHLPDSPISIATSVKLLQENDELAEAIASKLDLMSSNSGYCYGDGFIEIDYELRNMVNRLTTHGIYKMEDLDRKLNTILSFLERVNGK